MSGGSSAVEGVRVDYVDLHQPYAYLVSAELSTDNLEVADLFRFASELEEALPFVNSASPRLSNNGAAIDMSLEPLDGRSGNSLNDERRAKLLKVLNPTYTRRVRANARVKRNDDGRHLATVVTISLEAGDPFKGLNVRQYNGKNGVARAQVRSGEARSIIFTMETPLAHDDDGGITKVVKALTDKVGALLVRPVQVEDDDPEAALIAELDFASEDHSSTKASASV